MIDISHPIDITSAGLSALVWVIVLFLLLFMRNNLWPWLTKEYFPKKFKEAQMSQEHDFIVQQGQAEALTMINSSLIRLISLTERTLQLLEAHDNRQILTSTVISSHDVDIKLILATVLRDRGLILSDLFKEEKKT